MVKTFKEVGRNPVLKSYKVEGLEEVLVWRYWENREARTIDEEFSMIVFYKRIKDQLHSYSVKVPYSKIDNEEFMKSLIEFNKDNSYFRSVIIGK